MLYQISNNEKTTYSYSILTEHFYLRDLQPAQSINQAIENFTGIPPNLQIKDVAGMTDRLIVKNALMKAGTNGDISEVIDDIINDYLEMFKNTYFESNDAFVYEDALESRL